jgi:phytoene dehydrogenase-like protein
MTSDAIVVGAGPNGLTAAIVLAKAGLRVTLYEAAAEVGGGARSAELTLPGFVHDVCSAVHPLAVASPVFGSFPLAAHGLEWITPAAAVAHPLDDGPAVLLENDLSRLDAQLGPDANRYRRLLGPWVKRSGALFGEVLAPFHIPRHPLLMASFGAHALLSAEKLAKWEFRGEAARAIFAGMAAHSLLPLERSLSAAIALVLAIAAHSAGWPIPRCGSQAISHALVSYFRSLGGRVITAAAVRSLDELDRARLFLLDVSPSQLAAICGSRLPQNYLGKLRRFQHGPGVFKMDFALAEPVPWRDAECRRSATLHLGGTLDEIAQSEREVTEGKTPERPFVLVSQPSLFDPSRAPEGRHTLWAYCHVPNGSNVDMSERIENQIERFAPGFRDRILAKHVLQPGDLERYNANYIGGDISGGLISWRQLFARPVSLRHPYATPAKGIFICSASTPPGAGVHGMCGYHAAVAALKSIGIRTLAIVPARPPRAR